MDEKLIELLLEGLGLEQIANRLNVTEQQLRNSLAEILHDLSLGSLVELRFLALSLPGRTTKEKTSEVLELLRRRALD